MDSLTGDPILEELLLAHIEPKMLECIKRYDVESDGTRKLISFERFDNEELLYSLLVAYNEGPYQNFVFNIYNDGRVEA